MSKGVTVAFLVLVGTGAAAAACGGGGAKSSGSGLSGGSGGASTSTSTSTSRSSSTGTNTGAGGGVNLEGGVTDAHMDGDACGTVTLKQTLTPGNIVVVFDQSDSMSQPFDDDAGTAGQKWKVARDALVAAVTPVESLVNAGAIFFPSVEADGGCAPVAPITKKPQIKIESGASFVTDFQAHFSGPGWSLILSTPTADALNQANDALPDPSPLKGQRAVVLITDGAPTCDKVEADILAPVQAMMMRGIKTYAIGLPGSASAASLLNDIAAAGGTGTYISPSDPTTLQTALSQIASDTLDKCTLTLSPPPADPGLVNLVVTDAQNPSGVDIPRVDAGDGWSLSADGTTATLDGNVCATAKSGGYTSIQFVYGCPSIN